MATSNSIKKWRTITKQRIVDAFGGKCGICGYNRCNSVLALHHLVPNEKTFSFGKLELIQNLGHQ